MCNQKKLDLWADKLLDTGKRNNLISFKDTKASTAEILYPECEAVFSKCSIGHVFEVFDPKLSDPAEEPIDQASQPNADENGKQFTREEYKSLFLPRIKNERTLLLYAQTPNPMTSVKNIAKKAKEMQDETGINVAYLAFGFIKWREKENSEVFYRAPLLLVHVNVMTGSILDPVKIEISDDDVVVNPTFDYFLQAEYGLSLPEYQDADSLMGYYSKVAQIVKGMGWEIINECKLGIFSFLKINMYEDLKKNTTQILENENIKALMGEQSLLQTGAYGDGIERVVDNPLIELHTVVDADSSQIEAIEMAKSGKSFVLQGPPGTGKSQTITNIIAECLFDGKKVLFVSEKQAALNVVFDKLKKAKLEEFCLELHSHKANKRAVIEELNRTLELPRKAVDSSAEEEIRQKQDAQQKLDSYAAALHVRREPINKSLYQLFESYSAQKAFPDIPFKIRNIQEKGQSFLDRAVHLLEQFVEYTPSVGQNYQQNVWYGFIKTDISFDEREQLRSDLELLCGGLQDLKSTTEAIRDKYETPELNYTDTQRWQSLLAFSARSDVITPPLLSREAYNYSLPYFSRMSELSAMIVPLKNGILSKFTPAVISEVSGKELYTKLTGQFRSTFSHFFSGEYKTLLAGLQLYAIDGKKIKYPEAVALAQELSNLQPMLQEYGQCETAVHPFLGGSYHGPDTDWNHVMSDLTTLRSYLTEEVPTFGMLSRMSLANFSESQAMFQADSDILTKELTAIEEAKCRVKNQFASNVLDLEKNSYAYCVEKMQGCLAEYGKLGNWINFSILLGQLDENELIPLVDKAVEMQTPPKLLTGAFRKGFYRQWIEYIVFSVSEIASFSRVKQDQTVQRFSQKDRIQYEISKAQIRSELSSHRPNVDFTAGGSAVSILRREANKKRKQMSIRKLLSEIGSLAQILKPCFLMSPLSVSTFLDPEKIGFDTVIFDEASQIYPQDAIGAIYRGKQLIVVGDSRQMPPSNFFNSSADIDMDDEELGDINDFESILDVCSSVFATERLAWHYRSHYEQLIAFSNLHFYNNHLVTFPSSSKDHNGIGVDFYHVDGIFDRKSKTNLEEAKFIVELIHRNIMEYPKRSLGVVAFSVAQQNLIDKLLSKRRAENPSFEWFFKDDAAEPFFIKNLETVQGDERDTIIFSVAYARDNQGRFLHNFGPLNRVGGERRLNVAVTRAKENVQLVASIHYTDINLNNSGAEGTRLLRAYLDYAENGAAALERAVTVTNEDQFDSYFEQEVCDYLRDQGFTVDTQVGCSGYKIDLGLRKPDSSDYLIAIECDGATYHRSKNARDRDCLRQRVLESMGWKFYRIWSTDWYRNQAIEKERLLKAVKDAIANSVAREDEVTHIPSPEVETPTVTETDLFSTDVLEEKFEFSKYRQLDAMTILRGNRNSFQKAIRIILETEAPLSEELLLKRIVYYFEREKVTKVVLDEFNSLMYRCGAMGIVRKDGFLYLKGREDFNLRVPGDRREIKHIAIEELADGFKTLIEQNVSATREGLFKSMTNLLGFSRTGDAITERYNETLSYMRKRSMIIEKDDVITICQEQ